MSKYSIGIDPGLSGAVAVISPESLKIFDMPTMTVERNGKAKRQVSASELAELLYLYSGKDCHVYCERVGAVTGQGVTSVFSFGRSLGAIEGVIAARSIKATLITPQTWQKAMGVTGGKDGARARAMELFPNNQADFKRVKDDGRSDAALIAYWGKHHAR